MAKVEVKQITSKGDIAGNAFLNVDEEYGYVNVWGSLYTRETYLLMAHDGNEFHLVQFDAHCEQEFIQKFFDEKRKHYKVIQITKDEFIVTE